MFIPKIYTVENVTRGHPDKVCDQISDAILDEALKQDPLSRVAVESFGAHGLLVIGGEITTNAKIDYENIAREVYREIGYEGELKTVVNLVEQSPDIAQGVNPGGAGDQGIMYGYATKETPEFLPKGVVLARKLAEGLEKLRVEKVLPWLMPDGKTQVTVYDDKVHSVLVSTQHKETVSLEELKTELTEKLIKLVLETEDLPEIYINPTGRFIQGGFEADSGLTGRKIMVDTYGGLLPHGGGCFSGKDATKVDRSAAYMARFAAKSLVSSGLANECLVSVAYAIGKAEPLMLEAVDGEGKSLTQVLQQNFDFRPQAIIERLGLRSPIYKKTAAYGHFGRNGFPWEQFVEVR